MCNTSTTPNNIIKYKGVVVIYKKKIEIKKRVSTVHLPNDFVKISVDIHIIIFIDTI